MQTKNKAYSLTDWLNLEYAVDTTFTGRYLLMVGVLLAVSLVFWIVSWFTANSAVNFLADIPGIVGLMAFSLKACKFKTLLVAKLDDNGKAVVTDSLGNKINIKN